MSEQLFPEKQKTAIGDVAVIRLIGHPYQQLIDGEVIDATDTLNLLAKDVDYPANLRTELELKRDYLSPLIHSGYNGINYRLVHGQDLSFEEAYSLLAYVCLGSNKILYDMVSPIVPEQIDPEIALFRSIALLSGMSAKESYKFLTHQEIAGLVSAALELDTIARVHSKGGVIGFGGMGGARGYLGGQKYSKLFNSSTLAAIALSTLTPVHKHHSYSNTSKLGGQSAIESFGARSDFRKLTDMEEIQNNIGLLMTSCHSTRTLHTVSHRLKGETINHVVGPLAFPISSETTVNAMIGVNEKVHPTTVIKALLVLQERKIQQYGNCAVFCGLLAQSPGNVPQALFDEESYYQNRQLKDFIRLDEVAPPPYLTLVSFLREGESIGSFIIESADFFGSEIANQMSPDCLIVPNTHEAISEANYLAISFKDFSKACYVAMTIALALFTKYYLSFPDALDKKTRRVNKKYLRRCFNEAFSVLSDGRAHHKMEDYVKATKIKCKNGI